MTAKSFFNWARVAVTCVVAMVIWGGAMTGKAADNKRLNVLFIVSDDMNNDLGCYGHEIVQTPHLDRLTERGVRFDRAYCQVPLCNPSRVSYLSGLQPDKTEVYILTQPTRSHLVDWVMLPEYFRKQGYYTAQIGKIYHTGEGFEDPRSWDYEMREFGKRPPEEEIIKYDNPDGPGEHTNDWAWLKTPDEETPDGIVARRAAKMLEKVSQDDKPFFMGVGFRRPHAPFAAPAKYFKLYPPEEMPFPKEPPEGHYASLPEAAINYPAPDQPLTETQQRELIASYYACNTYVDAQVGVLLEAMDRLGLWENTVVVFFGDHGYHLGEHGGFWHKLSLFEESCRVPLIVYAPGMRGAGRPSAGLVELVDLYPTLTALCGLETPEGLDGTDLRPLLDDPEQPGKEAAYSLVARGDDPTANHAKVADFLGRSVRTDRWRYTEWDDGKRGVELYDHQNDPREWHNLADDPQHAATRARLKKLLEAGKYTSPSSKYGQFAPPDAFADDPELAYYGSENQWSGRFHDKEKADRFYKRRGQQQILAIIDGDPEKAVRLCRRWLDDDPNDLESLFTLSIAYGQLGELDRAWDTMNQALERGLPLGRYLAGPRDLVEPLVNNERFFRLLAQHPQQIVHGPMLGSMTDQSVRVWLRAVDESPVTIRVFDEPEGGEPVAQATATPDARADFTATAEVAGLAPGTQYWYDVSAGGDADAERSTFRTFPAAGSAGQFRVGFGGGAGYYPAHERIWDTMAGASLDALMLLGDNVYIDLAEEPGGLHDYTYYRRQSRPEFRRLVASLPVYAIWDDHDCAIDDVWLGPYRDRPSWKQPMLELFRRNWVNPGYGNQDWPACWFRFSIADVDFFLLDGRFYRTNPRSEHPTMLGPAQKAWLLKELANSTATFKMLVSPVAWAPGAKPGSRDTWDGFAAEREEIFRWIETQNIEGVVLVSADRHRSDAWQIARPEGYDLYDFMSSRLTNMHTHECFDQALFCYNEKCSFGTLTFDTTLADPELTYEIVNIDGEKVNHLTLRHSELED